MQTAVTCLETSSDKTIGFFIKLVGIQTIPFFAIFPRIELPLIKMALAVERNLERKMEQTSLNLVAIAVFSMVLGVLVLPLLDISPAVPAIATITILSLITLDSFQLQGKGGTIALDWFAGLNPQHRQRIIHHEAGHFLVAYLLEIPITGYTLTAWAAMQAKQPGLGGVTFETQSLTQVLSQDSRQIPLIVDRFCSIWMAGIAAEELVYGETEGGGDDRSKIFTTFAALGRSPEEAKLKENFATLQAKNLIKTNWNTYTQLVTAMQEGKSVEECYQLIKSCS